MCKRKFKSWSLRGFPIEAIYRELGETTEIDSILQVALEERHLVADMVVEDDDDDVVVDAWTRPLTVEHQPVFFEDLLREDIEMRTRTVPVVEEEKAEEEPAEDEPGVVLGQREFQEVMLAGLNALNQKVAESRELMVVGFKEIKEEMKSLNERVTGVEKFVSEYRMEGDLPSVINLSQGHGRYDTAPHDPPLGDSFNLLATAASKVTEERVEEEEDGQDEVIVDEGEQNVEKDKREKTKKKGEKQGKKKEADKENNTHVEEEQVENAQEQEVQNEVDEEQGKHVEEDKGEKKPKPKKRKTHSALLKPPYGRPNTRQKTTTEGCYRKDKRQTTIYKTKSINNG